MKKPTCANCKEPLTENIELRNGLCWVCIRLRNSVQNDSVSLEAAEER
jgi:hypothetical protein